jgi:hypothetical protein
MSSPLHQLADAQQRVFSRARQPVYRTPIGKPAPGREQRVLRRIGLNPETGLGQYPTPSGVHGAVQRVRTDRVEMRVYGKPAWDTHKHTSPEPDAQGKVWWTVHLSRADLDAELSHQGPSFTLGRVGADPAMADVVAHVAGLNFQTVETVEVAPWH